MGDEATALILHYSRSLVLDRQPPADKSRASNQSPLKWTAISISVHFSGLNSGSPQFIRGAVISQSLEFSIGARSTTTRR
jgi:hypothetical protein